MSLMSMLLGWKTLCRAIIQYDASHHVDCAIETWGPDQGKPEIYHRLVLNQFAKMLLLLPQGYDGIGSHIRTVKDLCDPRYLGDGNRFVMALALAREDLEPVIMFLPLEGPTLVYQSELYVNRRGLHGFKTRIPPRGGTFRQALATTLVLLHTIARATPADNIAQIQTSLRYMCDKYLAGFDPRSMKNYSMMLPDEAFERTILGR